MRKRYEAAVALLGRVRLRPAAALRDALASGYGRKDLAADVMAGMVVGVVALMLSMALAIATGVPPQYGLYTAIVAGGLIALLGGSRVQVSGPTAAFIVILAPVPAKYGLGGLLLATAMAGLMLMAMGVGRMGRLIEFIPHPVTTGFTAGIGVVIAGTQLDKLFGLSGSFPDHFLPRLEALAQAASNARWQDAAIGALCLALLLLWPKVSKRVPAPLVALVVCAVTAELARRFAGFQVATIASKYSYVHAGQTHSGIPPLPPTFALPWSFPGPTGAPLGLSWSMVKELLPSSFAIAMLGAIESLLSAVVADGMAGTKHDPDAELFAQGLGNVVAPFFGGFAATGAIARTATNVRSGARSPLASVVHALFILVGMLALAPLLGYLPLAALAALLLLVAWNMAEVKHFAHIARVAPKSDVAVLLVCFLLTVLVDMVWAVGVGVVLAALLFMRRMSELAYSRVLDEHLPHQRRQVPKNVTVYEIAGPLFFGAAQKAIGALTQVSRPGAVVVLDLESVPVMDVTGLVALESAIKGLRKAGAAVVLAGVQEQPATVLAKGGLVDEPDKGLYVRGDMEQALELARAKAGAG